MKKPSEFFQKKPKCLSKNYPVGSFKSIQKKLSIWFNFTINSQRTPNEMAGVLDGYIVKKFSKNPWSLFKELPHGLFDGFFESKFKNYPLIKLGSKVWVIFERTQDLPTG